MKKSKVLFLTTICSSIAIWAVYAQTNDQAKVTKLANANAVPTASNNDSNIGIKNYDDIIKKDNSMFWGSDVNQPYFCYTQEGSTKCENCESSGKQCKNNDGTSSIKYNSATGYLSGVESDIVVKDYYFRFWNANCKITDTSNWKLKSTGQNIALNPVIGCWSPMLPKVCDTIFENPAANISKIKNVVKLGDEDQGEGKGTNTYRKSPKWMYNRLFMLNVNVTPHNAIGQYASGKMNVPVRKFEPDTTRKCLKPVFDFIDVSEQIDEPVSLNKLSEALPTASIPQGMYQDTKTSTNVYSYNSPKRKWSCADTANSMKIEVDKGQKKYTYYTLKGGDSELSKEYTLNVRPAFTCVNVANNCDSIIEKVFASCNGVKGSCSDTVLDCTVKTMVTANSFSDMDDNSWSGTMNCSNCLGQLENVLTALCKK